MLYQFVYLFIHLFCALQRMLFISTFLPYFSLSFLALTEVSEPRCLNKIIGVQRVSHTWPDQAEKQHGSATYAAIMMGVTAHRVGL